MRVWEDRSSPSSQHSKLLGSPKKIKTDIDPSLSTSIFVGQPFVGPSTESQPREERTIEEVYGQNLIRKSDPIMFVRSGGESDSSPPSPRSLRKRYHYEKIRDNIDGVKENLLSDHTEHMNLKPFSNLNNRPPESEDFKITGPLGMTVFLSYFLDLVLPGARKRILQAYKFAVKSFSTKIHDEVILKKGLFEYPPNGQYFEEISSTPVDPYSVVEYDMDAQDLEWLDQYNNRNKPRSPFTENDFEAAIDAFEKEWHSLITPLLAKEEFNAEVPDDTCCDICGSPDASNANAIIFCDRCDVAVHQDCYGVPSLPEGKWLCTKCGLLPNTMVECVLCPHYEGALKPTENNNWAHMSCAHYIDEVGYSNETYLEPIIGISKILPSRVKLKCFLCKIKHGAPVQCSSRHCNIAFHARCGQMANLAMDYVHGKVFCPKHTPNGPKSRKFNGIQLNLSLQSKQPLQSELIKSVEHSYFWPKKYQMLSFSQALSTTMTTNSLQPEGQNLKLKISQLPPVLPELLFEHILNGNSWSTSQHLPWMNHKDKEKEELETFLHATARYWCLKRDLKGAPLIKRLFLECDTGISSLTEDVLEEVSFKLRALRFQLEMIRSLIEVTKRIFDLKCKGLYQTQLVLFLLRTPTLIEQRNMLRFLKSMDRQKYFAAPVPIDVVTDYLTIIKEPMDFGTMEDKVNRGEYLEEASIRISSTKKSTVITTPNNASILVELSKNSWSLFTNDFEKICSNAVTYNAPKTRWHKAAKELKGKGLPLIREKETKFMEFLSSHMDWMSTPIPAYLKDICQLLCPFSQKSLDEYCLSYFKSHYEEIDVEF